MPFSKEELSARLATADAAARQEIAATIKAESVRVLAEADAALATRRDPDDLETWSNILHFTQKQKPPPEAPRTYYTDEVVNRMIGELREQLDEQRDYISGELAELLTQVFNDVADNFESLRLDLQSLRNFQNKYVEADIDALKAENASLRADLSALQSIVGNLAFQVGQLADTVSGIERSASKVVALRGAS